MDILFIIAGSFYNLPFVNFSFWYKKCVPNTGRIAFDLPIIKTSIDTPKRCQGHT